MFRSALSIAAACVAVLALSPPAASQSATPGSQPSEPGSSRAQAPGPSIASPESVAAAEAAIAKSDWASAAAYLDPWLAAHPADARALFDAAFVAGNLDRVEEATALYRRAIDADPNSFEAHLALGLLLERHNNPEDARAEFAAASQLDEGVAGSEAKAQAWRALARIDAGSDPSLASSELLQALKISPETLTDTLLSAHIAENAGEPDQAEAAYMRAHARDPDAPEAAADLARFLIGRKQFAKAESVLRDALAKHPDDAALLAQLATVLVGEDKTDALPLIEKLYSQHPGDDAIARMLARIRADAGDFDGADRIYLALLKTSPGDAGLLVAHGENLIRRQLYAQAFACFDKAARIDAADGEAWSGLAFAALRTNQPAVAVHALTMRSKYLPELPSTYFLWATAYDELHQRDQAASYFRQFLDVAAGKFPDQEIEARQRLKLLEEKPAPRR